MIQLSEINLGYSVNETSKHALMCLLNLATEMKHDRAINIDREGVMRYCVEDVRYVSLLRELAIIASQIPQDLTPRVKEIAIKYLMSLYKDADITIITK